MMKLFKYLLSLLKILLPLIIVVSLIYFRHVIFLPNINSPFDAVQTMVEDKIDITVPVYMPDAQQVKAQDNYPVTDPECVADAPINMNIEEPSDQVDKADDKSPVAVTKSDRDVSVTSDPLDAPPAVEAEETVATNASEVTEVDSIDNELMSNMFETMKSMDQKIDRLFEMNQVSLSTRSVTPSDNSKILPDRADETVAVAVKPASEPASDNTVNNVSNKAISPASDISSMLSFARAAYWRGNIEESESMYLRLVNLDNDNPDIYGELGNVYYSQGKWSEAGKAYYEAAIRFIDMGLHDNKETNQLHYLLRVIQGLDAESAAKLKAKLAG